MRTAFMVSPKEPPGFLFDLHNERGEAGAWGLSVGAVSLSGRTNGVRYLTLAAADGKNCSVALMFIMRSARAEKYRQETARLRLEAERAKHPDIISAASFSTSPRSTMTSRTQLSACYNQTDPPPVSGQAWRDQMKYGRATRREQKSVILGGWYNGL
jgi:hypothetical protein